MAMNAKRFRRLSRDFAWLHQGIGVLGSVSFFVGSVFFLWDGGIQLAGVWLFIVGSFGMLIGNVGSFLVQLESAELES